MCKNLRNFYSVEPPLPVVVPEEAKVCVLDDVSAFETLCPISSVTGHRANPLDALQMVLKPSEARLVQDVLQEIPFSGIPSDTGDFSMIVDRLSCGTDAERSFYLSKLDSIASELYKIQPALRPDKDTIKFDGNEDNNKDS